MVICSCVTVSTPPGVLSAFKHLNWIFPKVKTIVFSDTVCSWKVRKVWKVCLGEREESQSGSWVILWSNLKTVKRPRPTVSAQINGWDSASSTSSLWLSSVWNSQLWNPWSCCSHGSLLSSPRDSAWTQLLSWCGIPFCTPWIPLVNKDLAWSDTVEQS